MLPCGAAFTGDGVAPPGRFATVFMRRKGLLIGVGIIGKSRHKAVWKVLKDMQNSMHRLSGQL